MTRTEIIELMARRMYDDEYRAMDELVSAMDVAAGRKCHAHSLGAWNTVNKLYEERTKSALKFLETSGLAIVPIEPSEVMLKEGAQEFAMTHQRVQSAEHCGADVYKVMIAAAMKEQEGRD